MIDTRIAHPAHSVPELEHIRSITARVLRGIRLREEHANEIEWILPHTYSVPSRSSSTSYVVRLDRQSCECPDHQRHPELTCLHIAAATVAAAKTRRRSA